MNYCRRTKHETSSRVEDPWRFGQLCLLFYRCYLFSRLKLWLEQADCNDTIPVSLETPSTSLPSSIERQPLTTTMLPTHLLRHPPKKIISEDPTPPTKKKAPEKTPPHTSPPSRPFHFELAK
jgi:hypothetical protein